MASLSEAFAIALDLQAAGRLDEAEVLCGRILDAAPDHAETLYLAGLLACRRGRFDRAMPLLERAVGVQPGFVAARLALAKAAFQTGDAAAAARGARAGLAMDPAEAEAWSLLGTAAQRTGDSRAAIAALARARRLDPTDSATGGRLGLLLHERGRRRLDDRQPAAALADLAAAAALLPFEAALGADLATALTETGRAAEAVDMFRRVLALVPDAAAALHGLGTALRRSGFPVDAGGALRRAAAADPSDPDPCEALAALADGTDAEEALRWSTRALAIKLEQSRNSGRELALITVPDPSPERTRDVVSFSLWGALEVYCAGALANARLVPERLPGWRCRFHHDDSVPPHILAELTALGAELVAMPAGTSGRLGMFWRFLPSDDPTVGRFLVRDCDSRLTAREVAAVRAWIGSGLPFHVLRDHVMHMEPVMGGMWGGMAGLLPPIAQAMDRFAAERSARWNDQHFLAEWLWPRIARRVLVHDGVHAGLGEPLPVAEPWPGDTHVGAKLVHLTRLPPMPAPDWFAPLSQAPGRHGVLVHPAADPHVGPSLAALGEWLEIEVALAASVLSPGDAVLDAAAGIGAHALAFARAVGPGGQVVAVEEEPGLYTCLARTVAASGLATIRTHALWPEKPATDGARFRLVRAVIGAPAVGGIPPGRLDRLLADHPALYLRIEEDGTAAPVFARLLGDGYRLWWHIAPVFNPGNRPGRTANPFPGLVTVNVLALPRGEPDPLPPDHPLVAITSPDADWHAASWRLTCDGR